jgi:hypothetical protein
MANQDQSRPSRKTERNRNRDAQREGNLGNERNRGSDESIRNRSDEADDMGNRSDRPSSDRMHDPSRLPE